MKKDPVKTAQEILKAFGGKENVISATHCATRLRVEVKDVSVIDVEAMKKSQVWRDIFLRVDSIR